LSFVAVGFHFLFEFLPCCFISFCSAGGNNSFCFTYLGLNAELFANSAEPKALSWFSSRDITHLQTAW